MQKIKFEYYDFPEFLKFLDSLQPRDSAKLIEIISKVEKFGLEISKRQKWIKKIDKNLYEIRSINSKNIQRVLYFKILNNKFIITHGFTKKTQKTPKYEITKSKTRRDNYLKRRKNSGNA
ncbi:type II toxin-antitoxin system RelE/ParE family toxin [Companilactobacillus nodensis]|uniref:Type II toxin-antitoxin system RelE/ParE family toxin n=1 Tax=Companilactobacillus nodensis DSM 19682 = JCM 14932 = NBRC 107160 TaxID=1423775 RepID=A0A0R1K638_9LACO|nr:type II toxin-antitoxin system RelE/ParE family toxin [Companilactobacillus nodensis]KRK79013.1 hypothetical protein FD03_GL001375 [Companilactobacillus nodensis DSM 19682 = JCM 14932 = NBRC 107160]